MLPSNMPPGMCFSSHAMLLTFDTAVYYITTKQLLGSEVQCNLGVPGSQSHVN